MKFFSYLKVIVRALTTIFVVCSLCLTAFPTAAQVNLPQMGDSLSGVISTQEEHDFGRELLRQFRSETPLLNDPLIEEYIMSLTFKLAANSELTDRRLEFVLIDSEILNAFAAPGGIIGVNAGLFEYAENEGQFASVIAHELAHVSQRHFARRQEQARNSRLPNLAATVASLVLASTTDGDVGQAALMTSQALALDSQLRYSRSNESEADRIGVRTLYKTGFDPNDMGSMFENMMQMHSYSQKIPEFLSTHPLDETRIADSKNRALTLPPVDTNYNVEYGLMRERVRVHYEENPEIIISSRSRDLNQLRGNENDAARYGLVLALLKDEQYFEAAENLEPLLRKDPLRISYKILQADIALQSSKIDQAISILEDSLEISPSNHPLTMSYALALEDAGRFEDAAQVLQKHALQRPNDPHLWDLLSVIQGKAGNISLVHQARAEFYFSIGDFGASQEQLQFALQVEEDPLVIARIRQRQNTMRTLLDRFYR